MIFDALLDDAAIFPPGNLRLADAVRAHLVHRAGPDASLVGPLVVGMGDLPALGEATTDLAAGSIDVSVTVPSPLDVGAVLAQVRGIESVRLASLEVAVPDGLAVADVVPALDAGLEAALGGRVAVDVFVELPRDERRGELIAALATSRADSGDLAHHNQQPRVPQPATSAYMAKLRTGGVRVDLYPDEAELAEAIVALVAAGVPFKATAGLHHAVRNTDPHTGFEQHGFLNVLLATDAALAGANAAEVQALLAERDGRLLADRVDDLSPTAPNPVRQSFRSFGTCSITDPVTELSALHLLPDREVAGCGTRSSGIWHAKSQDSATEVAGFGGERR